MYKKLLSNLPYNPSLIGQVSFYAKRLRTEEKIRRLGMVFVVLAFVVQLFAFLSQPESSLAASDNDILRGGFTTRSEAESKCRSNTQQFSQILAYYGVTCDMVASASTIDIVSNEKDYDSMGRLQQGPTIYRPLTNKTNPTDEYRVDIPGLGYPLWMRNLRAWDSYASSTYKVLKMTNKDGKVIMILYNCGNIVTIGKYSPPAPPKPTLVAGNAVCSSLTATALSERSYRFKAQTAGTDYVVKSYTFSFGDGSSKTVTTGLLNASAEHTYSATNTYTAKVSINVSVQGTSGPVAQTLHCQTTVKTNTPDACPYVEGTQATTAECDICPLVSGTQSNPAECKPCEESDNNEDGLACLILSKTASNDTRKIDSADGTMANGGDKITYTLSVKNNGKIKVDDFVVEENVSDILDYADITDFNGAKLEGTMLRWPATDLSVGETVRRRFTVKIKNPIPQTPISSSDPGRFDLVMNNVYGNQVTIKLPVNAVKAAETATKALPNTGPGETMAAVVGFTVFSSYFFARTRLFAKELDIVRTDYATTGGY